MMEFKVGGSKENILKITPLGAGSEVGRSCIILEYKNKKIMVEKREFIDIVGLRNSSGI